jgi:hypothetical protein
MIRSAILSGLATLLPLSAALAADAPSAKNEPRICRAAQKTTGSHIRTSRRCHSEEEWRRIDEAPLPVSMRVNASKNDGTQQRPQP